MIWCDRRPTMRRCRAVARQCSKSSQQRIWQPAQQRRRAPRRRQATISYRNLPLRNRRAWSDRATSRPLSTRSATSELAAGDRNGALQNYELTSAIARKVLAVSPDNIAWQHGLATSLDRVGNARMAAGDRVSAAQAYDESALIFAKLVAARPNDNQLKRNLSVSLRITSAKCEMRLEILPGL